ncbi:hypothetical protein [Pseudomonas sp. A34-9]|uniref:hypothetical protein n=1 Tax=Pseudomonas sp. A34-9 TaxID=3034675 RepID=UPI00240D364A|nr:hypothetical protein [Pseudomonas sp. A34-9]
MEHRKISLIVSGAREEAKINYDSIKGTIKFSMKNGFTKTYESTDLYLCLAKIRHDNPEVIFMCKGAKLNVTPSRMCSQMSGGVIAYELKDGKSATFEDIVQIFDYEENNLAKSLKEQREYYYTWLNSLLIALTYK